jgi:hypothetical protein
MTDLSAPIKLATSGSADQADVPAQRVHGMDRLREDECYHITGLILDCFMEAEHLIRRVRNKAQNRVLDHDGSRGTKPLSVSEFGPVFDEAHDCLALAMTYLFTVSTNMRHQAEEPWEEPPF